MIRKAHSYEGNNHIKWLELTNANELIRAGQGQGRKIKRKQGQGRASRKKPLDPALTQPNPSFGQKPVSKENPETNEEVGSIKGPFGEVQSYYSMLKWKGVQELELGSEEQEEVVATEGTMDQIGSTIQIVELGRFGAAGNQEANVSTIGNQGEGEPAKKQHHDWQSWD
ncbi:hypothetical protein RND71_004807 [Anisodus tanguticus]|uniref:Uncharacterized protein n=1 Tax=Anisodus tanguticus TaxID=243964 RepID=A0AAE1SQ84_9SOLA|nr:hypothetical protein RND71_004807 [Anisodus tanguticus]